MNEPHSNNPDAIRSDIDMTRRRMDDTMDALGERLQPRHLLDEFLGFFRRSTEGDGKLNQVKDKVTHSVDTAMHTAIDTIKKNPMPALLIGAGVAWMIYETRRRKSADDRDEFAADPGDPAREGIRYDPDEHYDRPLEYPTGNAEAQWSDQGESKIGQIKDTVSEKLSHAGEVARDKAQNLRERAGEKFQAVRERASDLGHRVGERTRAAYEHTREQVVTTADQHPLEAGLVCLAAGVIAGLALPTPKVVHRRAGPFADQLRDRTREAGREILEKGRHVAEAAMHAAKDEAKVQGLTPERLREQAGDVARPEGFPEGNQSGSQLNDPTIARPA